MKGWLSTTFGQLISEHSNHTFDLTHLYHNCWDGTPGEAWWSQWIALKNIDIVWQYCVSILAESIFFLLFIIRLHKVLANYCRHNIRWGNNHIPRNHDISQDQWGLPCEWDQHICCDTAQTYKHKVKMFQKFHLVIFSWFVSIFLNLRSPNRQGSLGGTEPDSSKGICVLTLDSPLVSEGLFIWQSATCF